MNIMSAPFRSSVVILLYHRVLDLSSDAQQLSVSPNRFADHMDYISKRHEVLSLGALVDGMQTRKLPKRGVVVTFDDGYFDNVQIAKPILERYSVPATFFITTGYLDSAREFWWDLLEQILLQPGKLPERLSLRFSDGDLDFTLGSNCNYSDKEAALYSGWSIVDKNNPTKRHELYRWLCTILRNLQTSCRDELIDELVIWSGSKISVREEYRPLSKIEMDLLDKNPLFEVGAHTVSHAMLSACSRQIQRDEIVKSNSFLNKMLSSPVRFFSYPYGSLSDYNSDSVQVVKDAQLLGACSNFSEAVHCSTDAHQLPRLLVRDCECDEFARKLEKCFFC